MSAELAVCLSVCLSVGLLAWSVFLYIHVCHICVRTGSFSAAVLYLLCRFWSELAMFKRIHDSVWSLEEVLSKMVRLST